MSYLNVGILAHVDAGKTSLTERLLYDSGVIGELGSVDRGTTRADSSELERRRGITINATVVSFPLGELTVNLVDTPGHPDFVAEVERSLRVLDAVILLVSAVEGVQAQTRVLLRTLARSRIPTLIFVNKVDRAGAREAELLAEIAALLTPAGVALNTVRGIGTRAARVLALPPERLVEPLAEALAATRPAPDPTGADPTGADPTGADPTGADPTDADPTDADGDFLAAYLTDSASIDPDRCRRELARRCAQATVHPVLFGSALTGQGVPELVGALRELLAPSPPAGHAEPPFGTVFKIEVSGARRRAAYLRMFAGQIAVRDAVRLYRWQADGQTTEHRGRVTGLWTPAGGDVVPVRRLSAGAIGILVGPKDVRIGDTLGRPGPAPPDAVFAPPTLEVRPRPVHPADRPRLSAALRLLAEQDPLIRLSPSARAGSQTAPDRAAEADGLALRLYGEVQREVIAARLAEEFGVPVTLSAAQVVYRERPVGAGEAVEVIDERGPNEFFATVGLRVEPGELGSGVRYRRAVELGSLPMAFHTAIEQTVRRALALRECPGAHGWEVTDCQVTLTRCGFASPVSTAADFRGLVPVLLARALAQAGTQVLGPVSELELEVPPESVSPVLRMLVEAGATLRSVLPGHGRLVAVVADERVPGLRHRLPSLTSGHGLLLARPAGYRPVPGSPCPQLTQTGCTPRRGCCLCAK